MSGGTLFNGDKIKLLKNKLGFKDGTEITSTEAGYLAGVTSDIQTQIDNKALNVTSSDTTEADLDDKLVVGTTMEKSVLNPAGNEQLQIDLNSSFRTLASTGLNSGAILSIGATTGTFDLTAGVGLHVDSTTNPADVAVQPVTITSRTNEVVTNIGIQPVTYISIDKDDNIVQSSSFPNATERRTNIFVGVVVHSDNVNVNLVNNLPDVNLDVTAQIHDLMDGLGFFNLSGNVITANGANLSVDKSAGTSFKEGANFYLDNTDPHTLTLIAQVLATFRYRNQDSSEGSDITVLDPTTYDNAGVTTTVPNNNNSTIQRLYIFPSGAIRIQRGQQVYATFSSAVDAVGKEAFIVEPNIEENGLLLASIVMKKTASDLTDDSEALIFIASRFGELGSVGSSAVGNLQQTYNNSVTPEIVLESAQGALTIRDNATPIAAALLEVQNNSSTTVFDVDVDGTFTTRLDADNIRLDGNVISTTDTDGNLTLTPNGTGKVIISSDIQILGTTTSVDSTTMDVADANISVNVGGNQASADSNDAGITVEMSDATNAILHYDSTLTSKWALGVVGSTSEIVTVADSQTLTNKTLTTPIISQISNTGTLTLPTSTDTLMGRATTDTQTNKTIVVASNTITTAASGNLTSTELNAALAELQTDIDTRAVIADVFSVNSVSINTSMAINETYLVNTSGGVISMTLPTPAADVFVRIKDIGSANTNNITVVRAGSETIDGTAASDIIDSDHASIVYVSDGTNWFKL